MNNEGKPIVFTIHAQKRLQQRDLSQEEVKEVVRKGKPISWQGAKKVYVYGINIVVLEEKTDIIEVITVYKSSKTLEEAIINIPQPYEWLKEASKDTFLQQAYFLLEKGLTEHEAIRLLTEVYRAVCKEYGD